MPGRQTSLAQTWVPGFTSLTRRANSRDALTATLSQPGLHLCTVWSDTVLLFALSNVLSP